MTVPDENTESGSPGNEWARISRGRLGIYTLMLNLGVVLCALDVFVVVTILPTVVEDIGGTGLYSWTIMLFMVGSIIGTSGTAPSCDMFGRRNAYVVAGLVFMIGNLGAALAPSMGILLAWRTVQGIGSGLIIAQSYGLVGEMFPPELRPRILAIVSSSWGVAVVLGPVFGGVFAEIEYWPGAFWTMVPLSLIFAWLALKHVQTSAGHGSVSRLPIYRLAAMAAAIMCAGLTSQIDHGGARLGLLVAAVGLIVYAVRRDAKAENRMFPTHTFAINTVIGAAHWGLIFATAVFGISTIYATFFLQVLHGQTPIVAGYISGLMSLSWTSAALVVAGFKGRTVWFSVLFGSMLVLAGSLGLMTFDVSGPVIAIVVCIAVIGIGIGAQYNLFIALSIEAAQPGEETLAASSVQIIRTLGIAFASAGAGLVANSAGMADNAPVETVAKAIDWVYRANLLVAILGVLAAVVFFIAGRPARRTEEEIKC